MKRRQAKKEKMEMLGVLLTTAFVAGMLIEKIAICGLDCLTTIYR